MFSSFSYDVLNQASIKKPLSRPATAAEAQQRLEEGNTAFRRWIADAYTKQSEDYEPDLHESRALLDAIIPPNQIPVQAPFAAVVGCSDARVPIRFLFGQSVNDIFEVRTAGQSLGDECIGSLEYALANLRSIKTLAVIGHTGCGAITATVDVFLNHGPKPVLDSIGLQAIINRIIPSVILANEVLSASNVTRPGHADFRRHLIELSTILNAAAGASRMKHIVDAYGRTDIGVIHGVYDIAGHAVVRPLQPGEPAEARFGLAAAPAEESDLESLAQSYISSAGSNSSIT